MLPQGEPNRLCAGLHGKLAVPTLPVPTLLGGLICGSVDAARCCSPRCAAAPTRRNVSRDIVASASQSSRAACRYLLGVGRSQLSLRVKRANIRSRLSGESRQLPGQDDRVDFEGFWNSTDIFSGSRALASRRLVGTLTWSILREAKETFALGESRMEEGSAEGSSGGGRCQRRAAVSAGCGKAADSSAVGRGEARGAESDTVGLGDSRAAESEATAKGEIRSEELVAPARGESRADSGPNSGPNVLREPIIFAPTPAKIRRELCERLSTYSRPASFALPRADLLSMVICPTSHAQRCSLRL